MHKTRKLNIFWHSIGYLWLIIVLYACLIPSEPGGVNIPHLDKLLHFSVYLISAFYFLQLTKNKFKFKILISLLLYGIMIEFLQDTISNRTRELADVIANSFGLITGYYFSKKIKFNLFENLNRVIFKG